MDLEDFVTPSVVALYVRHSPNSVCISSSIFIVCGLMSLEYISLESLQNKISN